MLALGSLPARAGDFEKDTFPTAAGNLEITFIGHGTLIMKHGGKVIHVDPYGRLADYAALPKADLILLTHAHQDHLDPAALKKIRAERTVVVMSAACGGKVEGGIVVTNGGSLKAAGLWIEAVPAYNIIHKRAGGDPYHPRGEGNGYVLDFAGQRVYVAGDTENIPEMSSLKDIAIAFLPMNMPYTMTSAMAAEAAGVIGPKVLYPYHYGDTDPQALLALMKKNPGVEVRIRKMQ